MLAWHITLRARDGAPLARSPREHRLCAWIALRVLLHVLVALRFVGHHVHLLVVCSREEAGRLAHALECALAARLPGRSFEPARIVAVEEARHLAHAFDYVLRNQERHGLDADPLHEGGTLPDLLGLRVVGAPTIVRVRALLPQVRRERLLELLGVASLSPAFAPVHLVEGAAAAVALPDVEGKSPEALAARAAAVRVASPHLGTGEIAALLGTTARSVQRARGHPPDLALDRAVALQMGHRLLVGNVTPTFDAGQARGEGQARRLWGG